MFIKIDHINMSVHNLEESSRFYREVFGFQAKEQGIGPSGTPWCILANNDFMLCLYQHPGRLAADQNDEKFLRADHFGFRINDVQKWKQLVAEKKLKLLYGGEEIIYPRSVSWYVVDPSGHEIEVSYVDGGAELYA